MAKTCEHKFKKGKKKGALCGEAAIPLNFGWSLCQKHAPWVKKAREILECREVAEGFPSAMADFWNEEEDIASWVAEVSTYPDQDPDPWTEAPPQTCETHIPCHIGYEEEDRNVWFVDGKEVTQEVAEATRRDGDIPPEDMGVLRNEAMARVEMIRRVDRARRIIDIAKREKIKEARLVESYVKKLVERYSISAAAAAQWVQGPQGCIFTMEKGIRKGFPCADFRMPLDRNRYAWPFCRRHIKRMIPTSKTDPTPTLKR